MKVRVKCAAARPPLAFNQSSRSTEPQAAAYVLSGPQSILDTCIGATSLIEVPLHSLESHVIACAEQEVLEKALQAMWSVHD